MPLTGSTAAQRQPAPRDSGTSYSSRQQQQAKNQPDLSGRLVYADPRSLPSFPSVGVKLDSTSTAALTASKIKSPPPILDTSGPVNPASLKAATQAAAAASAALFSAKTAASKPTGLSTSPEVRSKNATQSSPTDVESPELPSPTLAEDSAAAASNAGNSNMATKPSGNSTAGWGNSAATQAFRNSQILSAKRASAPPEKPIPEIAALGYQPSLRAAKGAMKQASNPNSNPAPATASAAAAASLSGATSAAGGNSGHTLPTRTRNRAQSSPLTLRQQKSLSSHYPDSTTSSALAGSPVDPKVSAANALSAATIAHSASARSRGTASNRGSYVGDAGSVPYTNMGRQMYTSHPPVGHEAEDQKHADGLHASAVAMAKMMYNPNAEGGASGSGVGGAAVPNVQEQAYKLAQERLEKLHELHAKDREYRDHYVDPNLGASSSAGGDTSRRLTMRGRLRRRRSSSDSDINADRVRSQEIRNQMSLLSSRISEVEDKRRRDRQNVLLAAQRNVKSQLEDIDEQVYANSGRLPPSVMSSIEPKLTALAQARADAHIGSYPRSDQVDIGGGKFMDRSEVDKIATRRVQPVIDDMHEKAQQEHDRQAQLRQEEEERKAEAVMLKARDKEMKDMYRQMKKDEKARKAEEKPNKRHSKILGIPIGFGLGTGAAAAGTTGAAAGAVVDKGGNIVNGKGKHEAHQEVAHEAADGDMMTAPDTSSAAEDSHANDVSSLSSPTAPAATGATGATAAPAAPAAAATTVAADITNASSLATAPVTQPVAGSSTARDAPPAAAPTAAAIKIPAADNTADRNAAPLEKSGSSTSRRLSKLFVKTPKDNNIERKNVESKNVGSKNVENKNVESNGNGPSKIAGSAVAGAAGIVGAAGAVGTGVASQAKSVVPGTNGASSGPTPAASSTAPGAGVGTDVGAPVSSASDKATTQSPLSPLSDNESASSPNSNKVKSWLKSRFSRDRSKSSASTTTAPGATSGQAATSGAAASTVSATGPSGSGPSKALGTAAVSDSQRPNAERSFLGGHALTASENNSPSRVGSGSLTMPLIAGGALGAAGGATAAGLASAKGDAPNAGQEISGEQQRNSINSVNQPYYTPTGSQRQSMAEQGGRATDLATPGDSGKSGIPDSSDLIGITAPKDSFEKDAAALAQGPSLGGALAHGQSTKGFESLGPLTPVIMGPAKGTTTSATTGAAGSSGLATTAGVAGAAGLAGAAGAAAATSRSSNTGALNAPNLDYTLPGNRTSYTSSHYSSEAGVPGAAGSGFGLVGVNIFANFSGVSPANDKTEEKTDKGNTFVSVPPPTTTAGESGANAGAFTPPMAIRDPAEKKSASPVRDSRFLENLEEYS